MRQRRMQGTFGSQFRHYFTFLSDIFNDNGTSVRLIFWNIGVRISSSHPPLNQLMSETFFPENLLYVPSFRSASILYLHDWGVHLRASLLTLHYLLMCYVDSQCVNTTNVDTAIFSLYRPQRHSLSCITVTHMAHHSLLTAPRHNCSINLCLSFLQCHNSLTRASKSKLPAFKILHHKCVILHAP